MAVLRVAEHRRRCFLSAQTRCSRSRLFFNSDSLCAGLCGCRLRRVVYHTVHHCWNRGIQASARFVAQLATEVALHALASLDWRSSKGPNSARACQVIFCFMASPTRFAPGFLAPPVDALELRSPSELVELGTLTVYDDPARGPDVQVLLHSFTQCLVSPPLNLPPSLRGSPTISPGARACTPTFC